MTRGPRAREFPMPALRGTGFTDKIAAAAKGLGWHGFPGPAAINSQTYDNLQPAEVVLLAGYTYENVRLLLLSKSEGFPNGLSNNRGQVGRHYSGSHNPTLTAQALAWRTAEHLTKAWKTIANG